MVHSEPYQAISMRSSGDEAIIILSEPPSTIASASLTALVRSIFGADLLELRTFRSPIGIDGWLGDLVFRVQRHGNETTAVYSGDTMSRWSAPADTVDRLQLLYRFLYQTNDGFWVDNLNNVSVPQTAVPDLTITAVALNGWTEDNTSPWISLADPSDRVTWKDVKSASTAAAYRHGNELVALVLPRGEPLTTAQGAFRLFAVASDLLAGAVKARNGNLVLLGRARTVPLAVLPPLRFETFANFAEHRASELEQSYERNAVFAGRVTSGEYDTWDWAPILLSAQLDDTEAGAILDLSDQVLKSWSQHGDVDYYAFHHPKPDTYPFGALRASDYFMKVYLTTSLTFNWNTQELSSTVKLPGQEIFAPNRTDALPVLYDPSGHFSDLLAARAKGFESALTDDARRKALVARDYFARLGDPLLVRDVQNVILYQVAQHYLSIPETTPAGGRSERVSRLLETEALRVIERVTSTSASRDDPSLKQDILTLMKTANLNDRGFADLVASPQRVFAERANEAKKASDAYDVAFKALCDDVNGEVVDNRCRYSGTLSGPMTDRVDQAAAELKQETYEARALQATLPKIADITKRLSAQAENGPVLQRVLSQSASTPASGFIRTPSVVLSRSTDNALVGGHNIYAETEQLPASAVEVKAPPIVATLKSQGRGTLLDEMRAFPKPIDMTDVLARAKMCDCDALITQNRAGEISLVRNAPPPLARVIRGKSGVLDAIAPPPVLGVVRFDGFPPKTVQDILVTKALMEGPPQGSRLLKQLRELFVPSRGKQETTIEVRADFDPAEASLELVENTEISPRFTWSGEPSTLVSAPEFNRLFGLPTGAGSDSSTIQVVVHFNDSPSGHADVLGVRAKGPDTQSADAGQRFKALVDKWLGRQPKNVHALNAAIDLNRSIRESMPNLQQELFLGKNTQSLRVANRDHDATGAWLLAAAP